MGNVTPEEIQKTLRRVSRRFGRDVELALSFGSVPGRAWVTLYRDGQETSLRLDGDVRSDTLETLLLDAVEYLINPPRRAFIITGATCSGN